MSSRVLVIGVDGVRFDYLGPEATPAIWALGRAGFLAPVPVDETTPTWSGPCWATIATGTGVAGHGITGNDLTGHRLAEHPDFVTRATRAGLPTLLAVSGWPPLALAEDGGPLFAEASRREFVPVPPDGLDWDGAGAAGAAGAAGLLAGRPAGLDAWEAADQETAERAGAILAADSDAGPPRVSFVYLGAVDFAGHATGAGDVYLAALRAADERVGRLLDAVSRSSRSSRPSRSSPSSRSSREIWTVVVVTDHGHLDEGGHGGREPEVTTAWAAAAGPGIEPGGPPLITRQDQVAPLVLRAVGLPARASPAGLP